MPDPIQEEQLRANLAEQLANMQKLEAQCVDLQKHAAAFEVTVQELKVERDAKQAEHEVLKNQRDTEQLGRLALQVTVNELKAANEQLKLQGETAETNLAACQDVLKDLRNENDLLQTEHEKHIQALQAEHTGAIFILREQLNQASREQPTAPAKVDGSAAHAMLKKLEWNERDTCPVCHRHKQWGHRSACELAPLVEG